MDNNFTEQMNQLSDDELDSILNKIDEHQPEVAKAALDEKARRIRRKEQEFQRKETEYHTTGFTPESPASVHSTVIRNIDEDTYREIAPKRYPILRFVAGVYKVLAWIVGILTILGFIFQIIQIAGFSSYTGAMVKANYYLPAFGTLFGGIIATITLFAISEGIRVFIDIEYNTRVNALK